MREIKFRAKVKRDAGIYEVEGIDWINLIFYLGGSRHKEKIPMNKIQSLMQYTGLKDKNGKEIYEGDIVKWSDGSEGKSYEYWRYCEIIWEKSHFALIGYSADRDGTHRIPVDFKFGAFIYEYDGALEIIGNIYENPNLLNATTR